MSFGDKVSNLLAFCVSVGLASFVASTLFLVFQIIIQNVLTGNGEESGLLALDYLILWIMFFCLFMVMYLPLFAGIRFWELRFRNFQDYIVLALRFAVVFAVVALFITEISAVITLVIAFVCGYCLYYLLFSRQLLVGGE